MIDSFICKEICAACGGVCCQRMPGAALPDDFGPPEKLRDNLREALASGNWSVDWWDGDPTNGYREQSYYIRPATKDMAGVSILDASWGGVCVFYTSEGCSIFEKRPSGCRGLRPNPDNFPDCFIEHSSKKEAAIAWYHHNEMLYELASSLEAIAS